MFHFQCSIRPEIWVGFFLHSLQLIFTIDSLISGWATFWPARLTAQWSCHLAGWFVAIIVGHCWPLGARLPLLAGLRSCHVAATAAIAGSAWSVRSAGCQIRGHFHSWNVVANAAFCPAMLLTSHSSLEAGHGLLLTAPFAWTAPCNSSAAPTSWAADCCFGIAVASGPLGRGLPANSTDAFARPPPSAAPQQCCWSVRYCLGRACPAAAGLVRLD